MNQVINLFSTPIYSSSLSCDTSKIKDISYSIQQNEQARHITRPYHGWQSTDLKDKKSLFFLYSELLHHMNTYKEQLGVKGNVQLRDIWININPPGHMALSHLHPHCFMSGVYYVQTPKNSGSIYFTNPNSVDYDWNPKMFKDGNANNLCCDTWDFIPKENDVFLFPSWARHGVYSNLSNEDRISISFNGLIT